MAQVAEIVTFKTNADVSDADYIRLSESSDSFVRAQPGFVHRHLSKGEDGRWTDYVIWQDMDSALTTSAAFAQQDFAPALMGAIDQNSLQMRHELVQWQSLT